MLMKSHGKADAALLAPCGIYCLLCHHHCKSDTPCEGCYNGNGKSEHCRKCDILACAKQKGLRFCASCESFPCGRLTEFDDYYSKRFGRRFLRNAVYMNEMGEDALLLRLTVENKCPDCGGVICIHDSICTECGRKLEQSNKEQE
jgi:hypothetical protein